jgi:hypothetical protein
LRKIVIAATAAIFVTSCSNDAAPAAKAQEATPTVLKGGQYDGSWKVASVQSVDRTTPATKLKQDSSGSARGCVTADGTIDAALFAEDGDKCTIANPYVRNGRIGMDLTCTRKGQTGEVRQSVSGTFTADALDAEVSTTTYLSGTGDYAMTRTVTAKRIGECPAATATEKTS